MKSTPRETKFMQFQKSLVREHYTRSAWCIYGISRSGAVSREQKWNNLLLRREAALNNLSSLLSTLVHDIKEFKNKNTTYDPYVTKIIVQLCKILIYYDIVRNTLIKKRNEASSIGESEKNLVHHFGFSKKNTVNKNMSIDCESDQHRKIKPAMNQIEEEEKDSSFDWANRDDPEKGVARSTSSRSKKLFSSATPSRHPTASIFSRETWFEPNSVATKSK